MSVTDDASLVEDLEAEITTLEWKLSEATKEIGRLRAALEEIAEHPSPYSEYARRVAHDALAACRT